MFNFYLLKRKTNEDVEEEGIIDINDSNVALTIYYFLIKTNKNLIITIIIIIIIIIII